MTYCDVCLGWQGEGWNGVEFISAIEVQGSYSEKLLDGLMPLNFDNVLGRDFWIL